MITFFRIMTFSLDGGEIQGVGRKYIRKQQQQRALNPLTNASCHAAVVHQVHRALPIRMGNKNKALRSGGTNDSSTVEKCDVAGVRKGRGLGVREKSRKTLHLPFGTTARLEGCPRVKDPFAKPFCFCTVCNSYLIEQKEYLGKRELTTRGRDRGRDGG